MPTLETGNNCTVKYLEEVTPGTTPASALTLLRYTSSSLQSNVATTTSNEIRSDRATSDLVQTEGSSAGDIAFEFSHLEYEPFIESIMGNDFSTEFDLTATDIDFADADNSINSAALEFIVADLLPGYWIKVSGSALNSGIMRVVSCTTAKLIVDHKTLTTEAVSPTITINGKSVRNGNSIKSFTLEEEYNSLTNVFTSWVGAMPSTMTFNASSGAILDGNISFMGRESTHGAATVGTGADVDQGTAPLMSAVSNVGAVFKDGSAVTDTYFKSINNTINGNLRALTAIGNLYPVDVLQGDFGMELSFEAYFAGNTYLAEQLANTASHWSYSFEDVLGNFIVFDIPRGKFSTASKEGRSKNSDMMLNGTIVATYDPTDLFQAQISVCSV